MTDTATRIERIWPGGMMLGEGPAWDAARGLLWFVDIKGQRVHRFDPADGRVTSWPAPAAVGWVLPAEGGMLLAGLKTGLSRFDPATGDFTHLADVEPEFPGNRLNDATVAPDGSVWFGSMDDGEAGPTGHVYRWDGRAAARVDIKPVSITNGPCFSPDGATLYYVDTLGGIVRSARVGADGALSDHRLFARIDSGEGYPDGVTCDSAGNVWLGLWNGWRARRYAPDGRITAEVRLPAANITKIALGGPEFRTAYATSARKGLSDAALAEQPDAGALFAFRVDVPGRPLPLARLD